MDWINVFKKLPNLDKQDWDIEPVLAYHNIYGIGIGFFYKTDEGLIEEIEEDYNTKYLCSVDFIKNKLDGNMMPEIDDRCDILKDGFYFPNLGTVTHWMPLPKPPKD